MNKKEIIEVLKKEIEWHKKNGHQFLVSESEKKGFLLGLKQAIRLIKEIKTWKI